MGAIAAQVRTPEYVSYPNVTPRWDAGWKTAQAAIGTTPAGVLCLGDSITAGTTPMSDVQTKCWPALVEAALVAKYGWTRRARYWHNSGPSYPTPNCPFSVAQNGHILGSLHVGWLGTDVIKWPNATPIADWGQIYTSTQVCVDLDVFWTDAYAGTWQLVVDPSNVGDAFTYTVDGGGSTGGTTGTAITLTNSGPLSAVDGTGTVNGPTTKVKKITLTGLPSRVHTLKWGNTSAQFYQAAVQGVTEYPTGRSVAGGLNFARIANSGETGTVWADATNFYPVDPPRLVGKGVTPQTTAGTAAGYGFPLNPHLAIIVLGCNDITAKTDTSFMKGLESMIVGLKAGSSASILLVVEPIPSRTLADVDVGATYANWANWGQFVDRIYALADIYNLGVVNLHQKWGQRPGALGMMTNNIHWNDAGHADLAAILSLLL